MIASAARFADPSPVARGPRPGCVCVGCLDARHAPLARGSASPARSARRGAPRRGASGRRPACGRRGRLGEPARRPPVRAARRTAGSSCSRSRRSRRGCSGGRHRDRGAGAGVDGCRREALSATVLARLAFRGAPIEPEHAYVRVFNGFAAAARRTQRSRSSCAIPTSRACIPVRAAIPAAVEPGRVRRTRPAGGRRRPSRHSRVHGRRRHGRAARHGRRPRPPVHPRPLWPRARRARPERRRERAAEPDRSRAGPSATAPRWRASSSAQAGPAGLRRGRSGRVAVADPRRRLAAGHHRRRLRLRPNRPAARQGSSSRSIRTRTAMRTMRRGWRWSASWSRSRPSPTARSPPPRPERTALDTLVVAPPETRAGRAGVRQHRRPGASPAALTAGAVDTRRRSPTGHVLLLAGLRVLVSGDQPLGGVVAPGARRVGLPSSRSPAAAQAVVGAAGGLTRLFDATATAASAARPCSCRGAPRRPRRCVRSSPPVRARGARRRAVCRPGRSDPTGRSRCRSSGSRRPTRTPSGRRSACRSRSTLAVGAAAFDANPGAGDVGAVLVRGTRVRRRPEARAERCRIGLATSDPGRNEDGAARYGTHQRLERCRGLTAGAAALLAEARPDLDAAGLKQALVADGDDAGRHGGASSTRPAPRRSSSLPIRPPSGSVWRSRRTPRSAAR